MRIIWTRRNFLKNYVTCNLFIDQNTMWPLNNFNTYDIEIMSTGGSVVRSAISSQPSWQDNIGNLTPGTYIVEIFNNYDKSVVGKSKFVKL